VKYPDNCSAPATVSSIDGRLCARDTAGPSSSVSMPAATTRRLKAGLVLCCAAVLPDDLDSREKTDVAMMMILARVRARLKFERD
jgi:hypothetical protein